MKVCSKCHKPFPNTSEFFYYVNAKRALLRPDCKSCSLAQNKEYVKQHKTSVMVAKREYAKKHELHNKEYRTKYYLDHKEQITQRNKEYYNTHKEQMRAANLDYVSKHSEQLKIKRHEYYLKNKEMFQNYFAEYNIANREKIARKNTEWRKQRKDYLRTYRSKRKDYHKIHDQARCARKRGLPATLTKDQWEQIMNCFDNKCAYCGKEGKLDQEHFIALINGGEYTHNNIIPACRSCNVRKARLSFFEWYPKQKFYSKIREQKILKFLNYENGTQQLSLMLPLNHKE